LGLVNPQKPRHAVPTLRDAEDAGNTSDLDVDKQQLSELVGGESLFHIPLIDVPLPDVPPTEAHLDGSEGEELTSSRFGENMWVWVRVGFL
jgi:hypothetical protein